MKQTVAVLTLALVALSWGAARAGEKKCAHQGASDQEVAELVATYKTRGWLGIETEKTTDGHARVESVIPESPAAAAGFRAGDVLLALNGVELSPEKKEAL